MPDYTPQQLQGLYEKLPLDLKDAIMAVETADNIAAICERNEITNEETRSKFVKYITYTLVGLLPPNELEKTLVEDAKLKSDVAKRVAWEAERFIFFPVKASLEKIYEIEIAPSLKPPVGTQIPEIKAGAEASEKPDTYREPIE